MANNVIRPNTTARTTVAIRFTQDSDTTVVLPAGTIVRFDSEQVDARTYIQTSTGLYAFTSFANVEPV